MWEQSYCSDGPPDADPHMVTGDGKVEHLYPSNLGGSWFKVQVWAGHTFSQGLP